MTPDELDLIAADGRHIGSNADSFASEFYETLFEIAPETRSLFTTDMAVQRGKLVDELAFLVDVATSGRETGSIEPFLDRARDLGARHAGYGVTGPDYEPVGVALVAALRDTVPGWDPNHELAWSKLYRLIADVMREGAAVGRPG